MKTENNKKLLAIGLIAVLGIAVVSMTTVAFSQGQGEKGEEGEEKGREKGGQEEEKARSEGSEEEEETRGEKGETEEEEEAREQGKEGEEQAREEGKQKEQEGRGEAKGEERARSAEQAAEQARAAAEAKGRPEVVENIDKAERYFGKSDKGVVSLKIGLEPEEEGSIEFGSAQLILIIFGNKDPMFRAVINTVMEEPSGILTACLDGNPIGELDTTPVSEEMGLTTGHLRANLPGISIQLPGISVDIVEGDDCSSVPILSGSV